MKQYSIRQQVAWLTLTPLLVMAVSLESFFLHDRYKALDDGLAERGRLIAHQLAVGSEYGVFSNNLSFLQNLAQAVLQQPDVHGVIIQDDASVSLVEIGDFSGMQKNSDAGAVKSADVRELVNLQMPVFRNPHGLLFYQPIVPVQVSLGELGSAAKPAQIGAVIIEMSNARTEELKSRLLWVTIGSTILFLIFPVSLIFLASRNIVSPIRKLSEAVRSLGDGKLDVRVEVSERISELAILSQGINEMAEKLEQESELLHQQVEDANRIAAIAFESHEGMMIVNAALMIMRVNKAFTRITSYTEEEAVGQTPRLLSSGRHDGTFYSLMWESIHTKGMWQGEIWNRRKTGEIYPAWVNITAVTRNGDGEAAYYVATYTDITLRKADEDKIKILAFNDELTHLPNRRMLAERLNQTMAASKRNRRYGALMFLDLDNFKPLNDQYGHDVGDLLLIEVARRLLSCVREVDTVSRFGGDEFVVLLSELDTGKEASIMQAKIVAEKIRAILAEPYELVIRKNGKPSTTVEHRCSSSIGVGLFLGHEYSADEAIGMADLAMYKAKESGRNAVRFCEL